MPPIPGRIFPIDPTLGPGDAQYRYGVVVHVQCGDSHSETLIFVDTDVILSGTDAINRAVEDWRNDAGQGPYSPPPALTGPEPCVYTGRIVSVGRRSDVPMFPR